MDSTSTASAVPNSDLGQPSLWRLVRRLLELIRFSHTVFALPFAALACVWAVMLPGEDSPTGVQLALRLVAVLICMVTARSAAMAFNRLVDARLDGQNPRTRERHLPAGSLSRGQVWVFFAAMSAGFVASCGLFLPNWLPLAFSLPVLAWVCGYSFAKRFTSAAHLWLGLALAMAPVCAWIGLRGEAVIANPSELWPALTLAVAIAFWVAGFDIIYACQDAEFDRQAGLHSVPARFGIAGALRVAAVLHLLMLAVLAALPTLAPGLSLGWLYYAALACVSLLVVRQHAIVGPGNLQQVGIAFFHINALISLGFCTLAAIDAVWH